MSKQYGQVSWRLPPAPHEETTGGGRPSVRRPQHEAMTRCPTKVLVVEERGKALTLLLRYNLEAEGYEVD